MKRKTSIQFAYLGKQIVCFLCLFAGANYDLNSNSVCWPRCSIHLVRKSSELIPSTTARLSAKNDSATNCLLVRNCLIDCVRDPLQSTANNWSVGLMKRKCCETHERTLSSPRILT